MCRPCYTVLSVDLELVLQLAVQVVSNGGAIWIDTLNIKYAYLHSYSRKGNTIRIVTLYTKYAYLHRYTYSSI